MSLFGANGRDTLQTTHKVTDSFKVCELHVKVFFSRHKRELHRLDFGTESEADQ